MAKKTRGKIRDRIDYSGLLFEIKTNNTELPIEQDVSENATDNSFDENRKDFFRMLSDEHNLYFYQISKGTIHEKHCEYLKCIKTENLRPLLLYDNDKKQCPNCALRAYLRIGAEDYK